MPRSKWGNRLNKLKENWNRSNQYYDEYFGMENLPEDIYIGKLTECYITEDSQNRLRIRRTHIILEGDFKGVPVKDSLQLETDQGPAFIKRWLKFFGLDLPTENPDELEVILNELQNNSPEVKFRFTRTKTSKGEFTNVRVISVSEDYVSTNGNEPQEEQGEQEIDIDVMSLEDLQEIVENNELDIENYEDMEETELRENIRNILSDDSNNNDNDDDDNDINNMTKEELLEYIEDNKIKPKDIGFRTKASMKKADEIDLKENLRNFIEKSVNENNNNNNNNNNNETLEQARLFCDAYDITIAEDSTLQDIINVIATCEFKEEELDDDEKTLLGVLDLTSTIIQKKKTVRKRNIKKK